MAENINVVVVQGNLTRDPELRQLTSGTSVCKMRIAVSDRVKRQGEWTDAVYYFDVTAWGAHGEACARYLTKGSGVLVKGKLQWREWDAQDGTKRQGVDINAERVNFLPSGERGRSNGGGGGGDEPYSEDWTPRPEPAGAGTPARRNPPALPAADDDDIPFAFLDSERLARYGGLHGAWETW